MSRFWFIGVALFALCAAGCAAETPSAGRDDVVPHLPGPWDDPPPFCDVDEDAVEALYAGMDVRQRIGQHVMTTLDRNGNRLTDASRARIATYALGGGFVAPIKGLAAGDAGATMAFVHDAQQAAMEAVSIPLFLALDQEGGVYASLNGMTAGTDTLSPMAMGATGDPLVAYEQFHVMGREVRALGLSMNLAPLLDTHLAIDNGNLNTRCFGPDPLRNAEMGVAAVAGLQQNLVLSVVKHFPGDGMTADNTHHAAIVNDASLDSLEAVLLPAFRRAFGRGADGVMTIPAAYAALDDGRSAITSRAVTTDLLRGDLGFEGLVVTDDLGMAGVQIGMTQGDIPALEALKAGADILLFVAVEDAALDALFAAVEAAIEDGSYPETEFAASTKRILRYKQKYCLFEEPLRPLPEHNDEARAEIARPEDREKTVQAAARAAVLLAAGPELPLATDQRVLCIAPNVMLPDAASGWSWLLASTFCRELRPPAGSPPPLLFTDPPNAEALAAQAVTRARNADVVIVATFQAHFSPAQQELLQRLNDAPELSDLPLIHVSLGVPFDHLWSPARAETQLALMGALPATLEAGARILKGTAEAGGTLPHAEILNAERSPSVPDWRGALPPPSWVRSPAAWSSPP